jgi:hypothetical protein
MRKLKQIAVLPNHPNHHGVVLGPQTLLALDENGETWFGIVERLPDEAGYSTDDRVITWQPIKGPPDGAHYSERKLSFWDQIEREGRENIESDRRREALLLATTKPIDTGRTVEAVQLASDHSVKDGEGTDPSQ